MLNFSGRKLANLIFSFKTNSENKGIQFNKNIEKIAKCLRYATKLKKQALTDVSQMTYQDFEEENTKNFEYSGLTEHLETASNLEREKMMVKEEQLLCIAYPTLNALLELRTIMIHIPLKFHWLVNEDSHCYLKEFYVIFLSMRPQGYN